MHRDLPERNSGIMSDLWISMVVRIGPRKLLTKDSLTDTVTRIPREYPSEAEARQVATR